ncbi:hypothetical protein BKA65DRAFT_388657, partial [Rhexocercosporidium sp. MPI-PUGE-AT-0058]
SNPASIITLKVGKDESVKEFIVHKDYACHFSPVLKAAFNSSFLEGQTQVYQLKDTHEGVVTMLVHWLYHQKFS